MHTATNDQQLLERFTQGDQEAFAELVARHGAMVEAACCRVLGRADDAEDAAQAVFLALALEAQRLRRHPSLGGWLHRVAWHVSLRMRESREARRRHEAAAAAERRPEPTDLRVEDELAAASGALDEELVALPDSLRVPLLLHHAEGRTFAEIASILGCGDSAVSMRLTRGRERLRERLRRRGIELSPALVGAVLDRTTGAGPCAPEFAHALARTAASLMHGRGALGAAARIPALDGARAALRSLMLERARVAAALAAAAAMLLVCFGVLMATAAGGLAAVGDGPQRDTPPPAVPQPPADFVPSPWSHALAVAPDRSVLLAGYRLIDGAHHPALVRWRPDGSLDRSFGDRGCASAAAIGDATTVALLRDGRLLVGGVREDGGTSRPLALRFLANGAPDAAFGDRGCAAPAVGMGKGDWGDAASVGDLILLAGSVQDQGRSRLATLRLTAAGEIDRTYGDGGLALAGAKSVDEHTVSMCALADGSMLIADFSPTKDGFALARLGRDGALDRRFGHDGAAITVINPDGAPELSYDGKGGASLMRMKELPACCAAFAADSDGSTVVCGVTGLPERARLTGTDPNPGGGVVAHWRARAVAMIVRYRADGSLDPGFADKGALLLGVGRIDDHANAIAIQKDRRIVVAVAATDDRTDDRRLAVVRLQPDGGLDLGFGERGLVRTGLLCDSNTSSIAVLPDGRIVVVARRPAQDSSSLLVLRLSPSGKLERALAGAVK